MSDLWDDEDLIATATGEHQAAEDYPEIASVVADNPPPEIYRQASFGTWWRDKASDFIEEDLLHGQQSCFCRYRTSDGYCYLPHKLDLIATHEAGHAVWTVVRRGPCNRSWAEQFACPLSEKGPAVGGDPSPVPWEQGGQRVEVRPNW